MTGNLKKLVSEDVVEEVPEASPSNSKNLGTDRNYKHKLYWPFTIVTIIIHILSLWGLFLILTGEINWKTVVWTVFYMQVAIEGSLMGAHRLFSHKSFKAAPALKMFLILAQTSSGQFSVFNWVRLHRQHHQTTDTDADPHNTERGMFFSHIGWFLHRRHPLAIEYMSRVDMSDMQADWMVMWQKKYYSYLFVLVGVLLPVWIPVQYFGESWWNSFLVCFAFRYIASLHCVLLINSAAHMYGMKPYDKNLTAVEIKLVSMLTLGEGWHNYHHAFPSDYNAAEMFLPFNFTGTFIRFCERLGLAWDLKTASPEVVKKRMQRTGDGSRLISNH